MATGTGIAPLLSMLESRLREMDDGPVARRPIVVHGVARASDLAWRGRLEELAARGRIAYVPAVSRPADPANAGWTGATGRVDALLPSAARRRGRRPRADRCLHLRESDTTDAASAALRACGLSEDAVRSEAYWVAAGPATPAEPEPAVRPVSPAGAPRRRVLSRRLGESRFRGGTYAARRRGRHPSGPSHETNVPPGEQMVPERAR